MTTNTNEPDKTKIKVSKLYDSDANPLWLSIGKAPKFFAKKEKEASE